MLATCFLWLPIGIASYLSFLYSFVLRNLFKYIFNFSITVLCKFWVIFKVWNISFKLIPFFANAIASSIAFLVLPSLNLLWYCLAYQYHKHNYTYEYLRYMFYKLIEFFYQYLTYLFQNAHRFFYCFWFKHSIGDKQGQKLLINYIGSPWNKTIEYKTI